MGLKFTGELFTMTKKEWCKIGGGTDLLFQKWHEKSETFSPLKIKKFKNYLKMS